MSDASATGAPRPHVERNLPQTTTLLLGSRGQNPRTATGLTSDGQPSQEEGAGISTDAVRTAPTLDTTTTTATTTSTATTTTVQAPAVTQNSCLAPFLEGKVMLEDNKQVASPLRRFYHRQNRLISAFSKLHPDEREISRSSLQSQLPHCHACMHARHAQASGDGAEGSHESHTRVHAECVCDHSGVSTSAGTMDNRSETDSLEESESRAGGTKCAWLGINTSHQAAVLSFVVNLILLIIKIVAAALSDSYAIIATVVDSALDLFSGAVFFVVSRNMRVRSPEYPAGKTRFEPLAVIFVAAVMGTAALEVILLSVQSMATGPTVPTLETPTIAIVVCVVCSKVTLYFLCKRIPTASAGALAEDHKNDTVSNVVALVCVVIANRAWVYADSIGAILVSLFIIFSWSRQGLHHGRKLAGYIADPDMIKKLTWVVLHHSPDIRAVDTVRAFSHGNDVVVEVDIVLPHSMPLDNAHDIGEALQWRLERVPGVERAYVHLDYDTDHRGADEHRDTYPDAEQDIAEAPWQTVPTRYVPHRATIISQV